jgi:hypothetical protein
MSQQPENKPPATSKIVQTSMIFFLVVGIAVFQVVGPNLFPTPPGGGMNWERVMWAGIVGGLSALIGAGIGKLIENARK